MAFHLHVLNLRSGANNQDLRQLFSGLQIEDDGVTITGGPDGEAFVTFCNQTDLLMALRKDGEENLTMKLATDVDRLQAINRMCLEKLKKMHDANATRKTYSEGAQHERNDVYSDVGSPQDAFQPVQKPGSDQDNDEPFKKSNDQIVLDRSDEGLSQRIVEQEPTEPKIISEVPPGRNLREQNPVVEVPNLDHNLIQEIVRDVARLQEKSCQNTEDPDIQSFRMQEGFHAQFTDNQTNFPINMEMDQLMPMYTNQRIPMHVGQGIQFQNPSIQGSQGIQFQNPSIQGSQGMQFREKDMPTRGLRPIPLPGGPRFPIIPNSASGMFVGRGSCMPHGSRIPIQRGPIFPVQRQNFPMRAQLNFTGQNLSIQNRANLPIQPRLSIPMQSLTNVPNQPAPYVTMQATGKMQMQTVSTVQSRSVSVTNDVSSHCNSVSSKQLNRPKSRWDKPGESAESQSQLKPNKRPIEESHLPVIVIDSDEGEENEGKSKKLNASNEKANEEFERIQLLRSRISRCRESIIGGTSIKNPQLNKHGLAHQFASQIKQSLTLKRSIPKRSSPKRNSPKRSSPKLRSISPRRRNRSPKRRSRSPRRRSRSPKRRSRSPRRRSRSPRHRGTSTIIKAWSPLRRGISPVYRATQKKQRIRSRERKPKMNKIVDAPKASNNVRLPDSVFQTLSPEGRAPRYNILTSDLPQKVTASMVWSWFGGKYGKCLGVIVLHASEQRPNAFIIFENEKDRDDVMKNSRRRMLKYADAKTLRFISSVIKNWNSEQKLSSPIFETSMTGPDREVEISDIEAIAELGIKLRSEQNVNQKTNIMDWVQIDDNCSDASDKVADHGEHWFVATYDLSHMVTATEVHTWFRQGLSTYKINYFDEPGPKGSEAIAFTLFENRVSARVAEREMAGNGYTVHRYNQVSAYRFMAKLGDKCMMTQTVPSELDRTVSIVERCQPPFIANIFTLNECAHMLYVEIKGFQPVASASDIFAWFHGTRGVVTVSEKGLSSVAYVAFATKHGLDTALGQHRKRGIKKFTSHKELTGNQALSSLSALPLRNELLVSTGTDQRKITSEEESLLSDIRTGKESGEGFDIARHNTDKLNRTTPHKSFIEMLNTHSNEETHKSYMYVITFQLDRYCTACQVLSMHHASEPICAAKLNFFKTGPRDSEGIGIILVKDTLHRQNAKICCIKMNKPFCFYKRASLQSLLVRISSQCKMTESSSLGQDRVIPKELLENIPAIPSFSLTHNFPRLYYVQLSGLQNGANACLIWGWFEGIDGASHGVILNECLSEAFVAFESCKERVGSMNAATLKGKWESSKMVTEKQVMKILAECSSPTLIKISTEYEVDRELNNEEYLLLSTNESYDGKKIEEKASEATTACQTPNLFQETLAQSGKTDGFYIRLRKVPPKVTANEVLAWYTVDGYHGEKATVIYDSNGISICAYIRFDAAAQRDKAVTLRQFAKACTFHAYTARINDLGPNHNIVESIELTQDDSLALKSTVSDVPVGKEKEPAVAALLKDKEVAPVMAIQTRSQVTNNLPTENQHSEMGKGARKINNSDDLQGFYIQLTKVLANVTACELLSWYVTSEWQAKNAIMISDNSGVGIIAFVVFTDEGTRELAIGKYQFASICTSEMLTGYLNELGPGYPILKANETGIDEIISAEERFSLIQHLMPGTGSNANEKQAVSVTQVSETTRKGRFYIRLRKVPPNATACEILSWYTANNGHGKNATLIRDSTGLNMFAYVMFEEDCHRKSALTVRQFAKPCTIHARGVCLAELDKNHVILESTGFNDQCLTLEERRAMEKDFAPQKAVKAKQQSGALSHVQSTLSVLHQSQQGESTAELARLQGNDCLIYYRFMLLPHSCTASGLWNFFNGLEGHCTGVILVRDNKGSALFAYAGFYENPLTYLKRFPTQSYALSSLHERNKELASLDPTTDIVEACEECQDVIVNSDTRLMFTMTIQ